MTGGDDKLHFHRLQHSNALADSHRIAFGHLQADYHAGAMSQQRQATCWRISNLFRAMAGCLCSRKEAMRMGISFRRQQLAQVVFDKARGQLIARHLRQAQQVLQQVQIVRHALQAEFAQAAVGAAQGAGVVRCMGDQLGQQ